MPLSAGDEVEVIGVLLLTHSASTGGATLPSAPITLPALRLCAQGQVFAPAMASQGPAAVSIASIPIRRVGLRIGANCGE